VERVPGTAAHCCHVLRFDGACVPVMDLGRWLDGDASGTGIGKAGGGLVGVYGYKRRIGADFGYGALWLAAPPQRVDVDDLMAAALPRPDARWAGVACACFADTMGAVPVLDLAALFDRPDSRVA